MSIFGQTKGTEIEKQIAQLATGEAIGGAMYYALAKVAKEQFGLNDAAKEFQNDSKAGIKSDLRLSIHGISSIKMIFLPSHFIVFNNVERFLKASFQFFRLMSNLLSEYCFRASAKH